MLVGILFLAWLGTPQIEPAVGQKIDKLDLVPLAFADAPFGEQDLLGKITVLHFWGTWCPPCRLEFPGFVKVAEQFQGNDAVQVISVSSSQGPEYDLEALAESTREFLKHYAATVPTYADPAGLSREQVAMLLPDGSLPYPCTVVLDRQGVVRGVWLGFTPKGMHEVADAVRSGL
jgi:thiol-disulfide isomerase/thioredoxin